MELLEAIQVQHGEDAENQTKLEVSEKILELQQRKSQEKPVL
jgi:hypothetical protein